MSLIALRITDPHTREQYLDERKAPRVPRTGKPLLAALAPPAGWVGPPPYNRAPDRHPAEQAVQRREAACSSRPAFVRPRCPSVPEMARLAEDLGFDGLTFSEVRTDPFVVAAVAAAATDRIELATSVAIAFPRSPMVVAQATHNLQELSNGRFSVGLGTQVKGHIKRRFSTVWDSPGPRLREYVLSLRAIWDCWQHGTPLNYEGRFYQFTLMTPEFNFGPTPHPLRIDLAAINPYNVETAATLARGPARPRLHHLGVPARRHLARRGRCRRAHRAPAGRLRDDRRRLPRQRRGRARGPRGPRADPSPGRLLRLDARLRPDLRASRLGCARAGPAGADRPGPLGRPAHAGGRRGAGPLLHRRHLRRRSPSGSRIASAASWTVSACRCHRTPPTRTTRSPGRSRRSRHSRPPGSDAPPRWLAEGGAARPGTGWPGSTRLT